jgi:cephalosporin-C deacetylase
MEVPLNVSVLKRVDGYSESHKIDAFSFVGISGELRYGWLAYPEGVRGLPAFLWVPPYGRESKLPDVYGTRVNMASMSFNLHGEDAFHQEAYIKERGYFSEGADSPKTWVFRRIFQDCIIALRILRLQSQVDADRISVAGMSQGAGLSIWLGAWCDYVKSVCADMPFLSQIGDTLLRTIYRYPLMELKDFMGTIPVGEQRVLHTLSYFDTSFQAAYCQKPTLVSMGLKDPACRPASVQAVFDALPGKKELVKLDWGHDWHPSMVGNNREWMLLNS